MYTKMYVRLMTKGRNVLKFRRQKSVRRNLRLGVLSLYEPIFEMQDLQNKYIFGNMRYVNISLQRSTKIYYFITPKR